MLERRGDQSGAGIVRIAGGYARSHAARAGRRDLLVRRHSVAGKDGDAHQRVLVGDHGGGCERSLAAIVKIAQ